MYCSVTDLDRDLSQLEGPEHVSIVGVGCDDIPRLFRRHAVLDVAMEGTNSAQSQTSSHQTTTNQPYINNGGVK